MFSSCFIRISILTRSLIASLRSAISVISIAAVTVVNIVAAAPAIHFVIDDSPIDETPYRGRFM